MENPNQLFVFYISIPFIDTRIGVLQLDVELPGRIRERQKPADSKAGTPSRPGDALGEE